MEQPIIGRISQTVYKHPNQELVAEPEISDQLRAEIKQIVREELDRRAWENLKVAYPPEFVQALQKAFPCQRLDSGEKSPDSSVAWESLINGIVEDFASGYKAPLQAHEKESLDSSDSQR